MKNFKKFENNKAYISYLNSDISISPNVSILNDTKSISYRKKQSIPLKYIPIEYIESTGNQCIELYGGYDPNMDWVIGI